MDLAISDGVSKQHEHGRKESFLSDCKQHTQFTLGIDMSPDSMWLHNKSIPSQDAVD